MPRPHRTTGAQRAAQRAAQTPARTAALTAGVIAALALLSACGSGAGADAPTWKPAPSFQGENVAPGNPTPAAPGAPGQPAPGPSTPGSSSSSSSAQDPNVVATHLTAPTGIAILPDGTALVGERTTGRIVQVQPEPGKPVHTIRTLPGVSGTGGGGLLDLALSPNYAQDNLIFAYLTTATDNRVVTFTVHGPITAVLTGIPRGTSDNTGRLAFAPDGSLLVGTGDAGHPALANDPHSMAGKVLRITDIGGAAQGNPVLGSRVWTSGHRVVDGLCVSGDTGAVYETETRNGSASDPVNQLTPAGEYGWPEPTPDYRQPAELVPNASRAPGGCAVLDGQLFVTSRDGQALLSAHIASRLGDFTPSLHQKYGRLLTVVAAPDGALWLTTSNKDGYGQPSPADERVLRIVPNDDAGNST